MGKADRIVAGLVLLAFCASARGLPASAGEGGRELIVGISSMHCHTNYTSVEDSYSIALAKAGHVPFVIPCTSNDAVLAKFVSRLDVLVLAGGADIDPSRYRAVRSPKCCEPDPVRDEFEFRLVAAARRRRLPIIGICRGCQLLNVAFGGTLWQDLPSEYTNRTAGVSHSHGSYFRPADFPRAHDVRLEPGTRLAAVLGCGNLDVNSHHHQAVKDLAPGFVVAARAADGVVEAIESVDYPAVGVQFHPEAIIAWAESSTVYDTARLLSFFRVLPAALRPAGKVSR